MADVEFYLEREGFNTIHLATDGDSPYRLQSETSGLGAGPIIQNIREGAGNGGTYQGDKVGVKSADLALLLVAATRYEVEILIRALLNITRWRKKTPPPRLVARYSNGQVWDTVVYYESGLELEGEKSLPELFKPVVGLTIPDPFWNSRNTEQVTARVLSEAPELLDNLAGMQLGGSTIMEQMTIVNSGDIETNVDWVIFGPGGPTTISVDGEGFTVNGVMDADDVYYIDSKAKTIKDQTGESLYNLFQSVPRFPMISTGLSRVTLSMVGAEPGTWVPDTSLVIYTNKFEQPTLTVAHDLWDLWTPGATTQTYPTTGWAGTSKGLARIAWTEAAVPDAAFRIFINDVTPGAPLSASMLVRTTKAQVVQPAIWYYDDADQAISAVFGEFMEIQVGQSNRVAIPGSVYSVPENAVRAEFVVSIVPSMSEDWENGDSMSASFAQVTETDNTLDLFNGGWIPSGLPAGTTDWVGATDNSFSEQYALTLEGASSITGVYTPRKEIVY